MSEFIQVIQAGGDVGVWVLVYLFHNFDKRVTLLEAKVG
jgi:hypothetical protein